ncbi:MAG: hypothetical protein HC841_02035 [Verrucomicrobiae bacterium]|nr:hypothetical protein [Verrucomicrobiae bacterium]
MNLSADDKANIARIVKAFSAPISFWGKVVDQNGEPVAGARIHYSAQDKYFGDSTSSYGSSDSEGKFSVSGLKGAGLFISVAKEGYYGTPKSGGSFGYGTPSGNAPPSADNPVVLLLHKRGECEPLVDLEPGSIMLPKDGVPVTVSLRARRLGTARTASPDVVFELRSDDKNPDERRRFDWSLRITAPGGGLLPRVGIFNFTAPADGYQSEIVINMPKSEEKWRVQWRSDFLCASGTAALRGSRSLLLRAAASLTSTVI